jgi:hypothetical protein
MCRIGLAGMKFVPARPSQHEKEKLVMARGIQLFMRRKKDGATFAYMEHAFTDAEFELCTEEEARNERTTPVKDDEKFVVLSDDVKFQTITEDGVADVAAPLDVSSDPMGTTSSELAGKNKEELYVYGQGLGVPGINRAMSKGDILVAVRQFLANDRL